MTQDKTTPPIGRCSRKSFDSSHCGPLVIAPCASAEPRLGEAYDAIALEKHRFLGQADAAAPPPRPIKHQHYAHEYAWTPHRHAESNVSHAIHKRQWSSVLGSRLYWDRTGPVSSPPTLWVPDNPMWALLRPNCSPLGLDPSMRRMTPRPLSAQESHLSCGCLGSVQVRGQWQGA